MIIGCLIGLTLDDFDRFDFVDETLETISWGADGADGINSWAVADKAIFESSLAGIDSFAELLDESIVVDIVADEGVFFLW